MPASRSRSRIPEAKKTAPSGARLWPLLLAGLLVLGALVALLLPASLATRFLPPPLRAEDFSGSLWHGSAGQVSFAGRDAGALEWHLRPGLLLKLALGVDLHWVKLSCVVDASVTLKRTGFTAQDIKGSGAIEDLRDLGVAPGWRGNATLQMSQVSGDFARISTAIGTLSLAQVTSSSIAQGAQLGSYILSMGPQAVGSDDSLEATLRDTGGPLEVQATLRYTPGATGMLTGTLRERENAAPALRDLVGSLAQMSPRDAQGRIPVELEFSL